MPDKELPEAIQTKLLYLHTYLKHLPKKDIGEVGAINETFKRFFGWQARTTGDGILSITERGENDIGAVADLLEEYLKVYEDSDGNPDAVLVKWVEDIVDGCQKAIENAGEVLPDIPVIDSSKKRKERDENAVSGDDYMAKRHMLTKRFDNLIRKPAGRSGKGAKSKEAITCLAVKYISTINDSPSFGCVAEQCVWLGMEMLLKIM
ncbi:hypothetical protein K435DRAFT_874480 [Dendrothele bispora CBS 962.96]|uniref:Uncharacterized protein n=1 Tax=Dendrothele bispora (strain CBS 962.96) TaxID=1314807 RepID=A0A4S8KWS6_DENBC|nr:hypothetical protein K435DRAFT_874480 [Dendrothele bispora CBS 962.96]